MSNVKGVIVDEAKGWYTYRVILDRDELVVLRKSRRLYPKAFIYSEQVCSGNKAEISKYWTFGKAPSSYVKDKLLRAYTIHHAVVDPG
jgi:hypothetical protein